MKPELRRLVKKLLRRVAEDRLEARARLKTRIDLCAEDGLILIVESGMDCDGSAWSGRTALLQASVMVFEKAYEEKISWADGPISWVIHKPSEKSSFSESHRDLALEAFENGHPHVLRYSSF